MKSREGFYILLIVILDLKSVALTAGYFLLNSNWNEWYKHILISLY